MTLTYARQLAANTLAAAFEIALPDLISEEEILYQLECRISQLLQGSPAIFFGLMYRLDIAEKDLRDVINKGADVVGGLARLVYARQLEKAESRSRFQHVKRDEDDSLTW